MAYVTIKRSEHGAFGYQASQNFTFAQNMPVTNIIWEEVPNVSQHLPVAFQLIEVNDQKSLELVAIHSLDNERNFMVLPDGRWLGGYIPAIYRSEPFALLPDKDDPKNLQLSVREERMVATTEADVIPFFDDSGAPSERLNTTLKFLGELTKGHRKTQLMIMKLQQYGVLEPWYLEKELQLSEDSPFTNLPKHLYHTNLNKVNQLPDEAIADLQRSGALHLASLQYSSEFRLKGLISLARMYDEVQEKFNQTPEQPNIDALFGEGEDVFSF